MIAQEALPCFKQHLRVVSAGSSSLCSLTLCMVVNDFAVFTLLESIFIIGLHFKHNNDIFIAVAKNVFDNKLRVDNNFG